MTISKLAKEIGVTPQAIYQKIRSKQYINQFKKDVNGKLLLDAESIEFIKNLFVNTLEKDVNETVNANQLFYKIEMLENELKLEREHSRKQADEITNFAKQFAELTKNNQILLGIEQNKTAPKMIEPPTKKGFWNFFKKKEQSS